MLLSQKIVLAYFIWTVVSIFISFTAGFEVFFTLEIIGLLIVREFVDSFAERETKDRLNLFIYAGLFLFALIVLRRIILALS